MVGNNVVWQPEVVEEMLRYYKEKIKLDGRQVIFKEAHHDECAKQINARFSTHFTQRQVYHKFHKLKAQWKLILDAKNLSGANFDEVEKKILYEETEVVRMKNDKDKRAKFINVPILWYDEMEFIFQDKHATGEFNILQTPYDHTSNQDDDIIGEKNGTGADDIGYDSDCLPGNNIDESSSSKRPKNAKGDKGKRIKHDDGVVQGMTDAFHVMSNTMRFTHVTHPNETLFKIIDDMEEYPIFVRLALQTTMAENDKTAAMLKGRPLSHIKEFVQRWVAENYPGM